MRLDLLIGTSFVALVSAPAAVHGQEGHKAPASDNVLLAAEDAFGERIGIEQIGLYSEHQSRGFSLANTGAYRIDGAYFAPTTGLVEPLIGGVSVRLGVNAARLDYPSPSGVVNYRLQTAPAGTRLNLNVGDRHFGSFFAELNGSTASADGRVGVAGGVFLQPHINRPIGGEGEQYYAGIVPFWQPNDNLRIRGLAGYRTSKFVGGYTFTVNEAALEVKPNGRQFYGPSWSHSEGEEWVTGGIVDFAPSSAWRFSGSTFYSVNEPEFTDMTMLTVRPDGKAAAMQTRIPDRYFTSMSSEARATYRFPGGNVDHTLGFGIRNRDSYSRTATGTRYNLGVVDLENPAFGAEPAFSDNGARTIDKVDQLTGSANYSALIGGKIELKGGLHLTRYEKEVSPPGGLSEGRTESNWLYNLSGIYLLDPKTTFFASYVKGLEEAGVAPSNAANRGEILPPVIAEQYELGFRRKLGSGLTLIGALFDISKPTPGLRGDGQFTFVGEVRHRGAELSLNGRVGKSTSIVAGAVAMKPRISGELVESGSVGEKPAGVPPLVAFLSLDQRLPVEGLSMDGRISHSAKRPANTLNTLNTPAITSVDLGGRYMFNLGENPAVFRLTLVNLFNERDWVAGSSGTMNPTTPRFVRTSLTIPLVAK